MSCAFSPCTLVDSAIGILTALVFDDAPVKLLFALNLSYWKIDYNLFGDRERFGVDYAGADILDAKTSITVAGRE